MSKELKDVKYEAKKLARWDDFRTFPVLGII